MANFGEIGQISFKFILYAASIFYSSILINVWNTKCFFLQGLMKQIMNTSFVHVSENNKEFLQYHTEG